MAKVAVFRPHNARVTFASELCLIYSWDTYSFFCPACGAMVELDDMLADLCLEFGRA